MPELNSAQRERVWFGSAAKPGPEHYRRRINRQDQVWTYRMGKWLLGGLSDGCSGSPQSEAGAAQLVHAAVQVLYVLIAQQNVPISSVPGAFDRMMERFIHQSVAAYPCGQDFLTELTVRDRAINLSDPGNYLLYSMLATTMQATVLALCVHEDAGGVVLVRGDGFVHVDGRLTKFDYNYEGNSTPPYLSYGLAIKGQEYPGRPEELHSKAVVVPPGFRTVGVTSDGWPWHHPPAYPFGHWKYASFIRWLRDLNNRRADEKAPPLTEEQAWGLYRPEHVDDLARKLVKESADETTGHSIFTDDVSGIFAERAMVP